MCALLFFISKTVIGELVAASHCRHAVAEPVTALFFVFFFGSSIMQFIAIVQGNRPLPRWYCVFNLIVFLGAFNSIKAHRELHHRQWNRNV